MTIHNMINSIFRCSELIRISPAGPMEAFAEEEDPWVTLYIQWLWFSDLLEAQSSGFCDNDVFEEPRSVILRILSDDVFA